MKNLDVFSFISSCILVLILLKNKKNKKKRSNKLCSNIKELSGYERLIGHTPLIQLQRLSKILGSEIYLKV